MSYHCSDFSKTCEDDASQFHCFKDKFISLKWTLWEKVKIWNPDILSNLNVIWRHSQFQLCAGVLNSRLIGPKDLMRIVKSVISKKYRFLQSCFMYKCQIWFNYSLNDSMDCQLLLAFKAWEKMIKWLSWWRVAIIRRTLFSSL